MKLQQIHEINPFPAMNIHFKGLHYELHVRPRTRNKPKMTITHAGSIIFNKALVEKEHLDQFKTVQLAFDKTNNLIVFIFRPFENYEPSEYALHPNKNRLIVNAKTFFTDFKLDPAKIMNRFRFYKETANGVMLYVTPVNS